MLEGKSVLLIINDSRRGGGQKNVLQIADYLGDSYSVYLACPRGPLSEQGKSAGIETLDISEGPGSIWQIRQIIRKLNPSVVHAHLLGTAFYAAVGSIGIGVPLIVTLHNPVVYSGVSLLRKLSYPLALKGICLKATAVIGASQVIREEINTIVRKRVAIHVANTVQVPVLENPRAECFVRGRLTLAIVGALTHAKGHSYLITAVAELRKGMNIRLMIVGGGPLLTPLQAMVSDLGVNADVEFVGEVGDVTGFLKDADIVVVPSVFEGTPYTLLEAMALGKPIIATSVGGIPAIIRNGENGILVPPKDSAEIASAVRRLAGDADLRSRMAARARQSIAVDLNYEKSMRTYSKAYDDAINGV